MQKLNREMMRQKRKVSDRFKKFIEHWANKCRMLENTSKKSDRQNVTNDIVIGEVRCLRLCSNFKTTKMTSISQPFLVSAARSSGQFSI